LHIFNQRFGQSDGLQIHGLIHGGMWSFQPQISQSEVENGGFSVLETMMTEMGMNQYLLIPFLGE